MFGLAFKENTDDISESPVVTLLEQLIGKGREVRVFDSHIRIAKIYGSNRNFTLAAIPHIERLMAPRLEDLLEWADCVVVAQKPGAAIAGALVKSAAPMVSLDRGALGRLTQSRADLADAAV